MENDIMLAVESCDEDILYKIQRQQQLRQIVRIQVHDPDIIPKAHRNYGPDAVLELAKLSAWKDTDWSRLDVYREEEGEVRCVKDDPPFDGVPPNQLWPERYPTYNVFDLSIHRKVKQRTAEATSPDGRACYFKATNFPHELRWTIQEIRAYQTLAEAGCSLVPNLIGYVSETPTLDRVAGFLVEKVDGRHAESADLEPCLKALDQLHRYIVHGDPCKYNILITDKGPMFIDLEDSIIVADNDGTRDLETLKKKERDNLAAELADSSGRGRPYSQ